MQSRVVVYAEERKVIRNWLDLAPLDEELLLKKTTITLTRSMEKTTMLSMTIATSHDARRDGGVVV